MSQFEHNTSKPVLEGTEKRDWGFG